MKVFLALLAACLPHHGSAADCNGGIMVGPLDIEGYPDVWLAGENGTGNGDHLEIRHNAGVTPFTSCEEEWMPDSIAQFKLLGRKLSFTVDLSSVGCACNLALYMISMPGLDKYGKPQKGDGSLGQPPYYCDANKVGGQWCPEVDIMEANDHAFQATPHRCEKPTNGHYSACDRSGCHENTREVEGAYGPGDNFTIDTRRPFDVHTEFLEERGELTGMRTTLQQHERSVVMAHKSCSAEYLAGLSGALADGMSLRITYWGEAAETMAWMDSPPCGEQVCTGDHAGLAKISKLRVTPEIVAKSLTQRQDARSRADASEDASQEKEQGKPSPSPSPSPPKTEAPLWPWISLDPKTTTAEPTTTKQVAVTKPAMVPLPIWVAPAAITTTAQPATASTTEASAKGVSHWVPDVYAPWECHQYVGNQQMTDWCKVVGFADGYEFQDNGGMDSPCGACWCCKRKAKYVEAPKMTTTRASRSEQGSDSLIWVVNDPKDDLFGEIVPEEIIGDGKKFVALNDRGIAEFREERHFVQRMTRADYDAREGKEWAKWLPKTSPCPDGADGPCEESISDASFLDMLVAKYNGETPSSATASKRWMPTGPMLAVALLLPLAAVAAFATRLFRHRRHPGGSSPRDPEAGGPRSPRSRTASTDSTCITAQTSEGPSPLRARTASSSSATPLVLAKSGPPGGWGLQTMQEAVA